MSRSELIAEFRKNKKKSAVETLKAESKEVPVKAETVTDEESNKEATQGTKSGRCE